MAAKKDNPGFRFVIDCLKRKPKAPFAEIRDAAVKKKFTIYPIVYGRAKALLGLVPSKPYGTGRSAMATKAKAAGGSQNSTAAAPKRRGRPPKSAQTTTSSTGSIGDLVAAVQSVERERNQMRATLEKMRSVIDSVL